jgi:hypothetical protein
VASGKLGERIVLLASVAGRVARVDAYPDAALPQSGLHPVEDALQLLGGSERVLPIIQREGLLEPCERAVGLDPLLLRDPRIGPGD